MSDDLNLAIGARVTAAYGIVASFVRSKLSPIKWSILSRMHQR